MSKQLKTLTAACGLAFAAHPAVAAAQVPSQEIDPQWTVTTVKPLAKIDNFSLEKVPPEISFSITRPLHERQEVTVEAGQRHLSEEEWRHSRALRQDMGDMGEARLKFMKIEWRLKFGGPR